MVADEYLPDKTNDNYSTVNDDTHENNENIDDVGVDD